MRYASYWLVLAVASGCTREQVACDERPDDPVCARDGGVDGATVDGSKSDGGDADGGSDARGCSPACTGVSVCDPETLSCVGCVSDDDCGGAAPHCKEHACVGCADDGDCDGETPVCVDGACAECNDADDCDVGTPMCIDAECVECEASSDCTTATRSRCDDGACEACVSDADCAHVVGLGVCDAGTCVQCTSAKTDACGGKVCDVAMRTCSTFDPGSAGACQTCVADAQCRTGMLCVEEEFDDMELGARCFWKQDAPSPGPGGTCTAVPPYVQAQTATQIDGASARVCGLQLSTCEAHADFRVTGCSSPAPPALDAVCGARDVDDGYCARVDATTTRCTVACAVTSDCPCSGLNCSRQAECTADGICSLTRTCPVSDLTNCS